MFVLCVRCSMFSIVSVFVVVVVAVSVGVGVVGEQDIAGRSTLSCCIFAHAVPIWPRVRARFLLGRC